MSFARSSLSEWTLDLDIWENMGEAKEDESLGRSIYSNNNPIDATVLDAPNPEEVGKEDVLEVHKKIWGSLASQLSISMPYTFRLGYFLESISLGQDRDVELLQKLSSGVAADRTWYEKGFRTTNICVADLEAQGLGNFTEWQGKLRMALKQIGWAEAEVSYLQVVLGDAKFTQKNHEYELTLIFDKLSVFQEGVLQNIFTVTKILEKMNASTLTGLIDKGCSQLETLVEHISELEKDRI